VCVWSVCSFSEVQQKQHAEEGVRGRLAGQGKGLWGHREQPSRLFAQQEYLTDFMRT